MRERKGGVMQGGSTSETLLALVLERRFGSAWLRRWQAVDDIEVRWLAIHVADEAARQPDLDGLQTITEGRHWLPETARTPRNARTLLVLLTAVGLWPPDAAGASTSLRPPNAALAAS